MGESGVFLRFRYVNHRGQHHEYLVRPVEISRPDARWCLEAEVIERDGAARPGRRTFALSGLRDAEDVFVPSSAAIR